MPEYLFQTIASAMHKKNDDGEEALFDGLINKAKLKFCNVAKQYIKTRDNLVENSGYIEKPHYLESYYSLTKNVSLNDFR